MTMCKLAEIGRLIEMDKGVIGQVAKGSRKVGSPSESFRKSRPPTEARPGWRWQRSHLFIAMMQSTLRQYTIDVRACWS